MWKLVLLLFSWSVSQMSHVLLSYQLLLCFLFSVSSYLVLFRLAEGTASLNKLFSVEEEFSSKAHSYKIKIK